MRCPRCQAQNPVGTNFCGHCGGPLQAGSAETVERRQLTVLFCDLVDSTQLAESVDADDLRDITSEYHTVCDTIIRRHEGHIAQYLGDGVMVYFGYPVAHEDDARRAVRTGLELTRALATLSARLGDQRGVALVARVGIHTGPALVGEVGGGQRREHLALGTTPTLASRIQGVAAPATVVVSHDTYRIVQGFFDVTVLGPQSFKGLAQTVALYQVDRESGADSRLDAGHRTGLTPLIGRDNELTLLEHWWDRLSTLGGHAVIVRGEAGIGKSRLVDALKARIARDTPNVLECSCTPYAQNTPLFPIVGLAERTLGFSRETADADKRAALAQRLDARGLLTDEAIALMAELLTIPVDGGPDPLAAYSPQKRRERSLETLLAWMLAVAHGRPTLWVIEDLHWADPTTLELVGTAVGSLSAVPLLVVLTSRGEAETSWPASDRISSLALKRLSTGETESMASRVAHDKTIPASVLTRIVARADGVPLFVEEVTKAVLEMGVLIERNDHYELAGPLPADLIPATVQGSLDARLDRLGPAKVTAQLAATIGREFSYELLSAVAAEAETALRSSLERLIAAELVFRNADSPDETYRFKHALVRDAAYDSLPKRARRGLHERIAEALLRLVPDAVQQHPELLAEHYEAAGQAEHALRCWWQGGQLALGRGANQEAISHLHRGLALVDELPVEERRRQELELLIALVPALIASEGWAAPQLKPVYGRAQALVDLLGNSPHRFTVLAGTMGYHFVAGRVTQAVGLARQILELAESYGDPLLLTVGHQDCSAAYCYHGDFDLAVQHADAGLAMLDIGREQYLARTLGLSSSVGILGYQYIAFWMQGLPDRSTRTAEGCVSLAREVGHLPSLQFALTASTGSAYLQGDAKQVLAAGDAALRMAREERLAFWEPMITVFVGWGLSELGQHAEGVAQIRDAIGRYRAAGNGVLQVWMQVILADAQWKAGQPSEAFDTLTTARTLASEHGEGLFEPELYRLEGEFLVAQALEATGSTNEGNADRVPGLVRAERWMREALELSRRQGAKMLELRSLVSLCRLQQAMAGTAAEGEALARLHDSFTEGIDTRDLREARSVLHALGVRIATS